MFILMIENSQQQRGTSAAVESFRNEMVKANQASQQSLLQALTMTNKAPPTILGE
jgi:DNA uptake protein ComE-like DNA-binding protein